MEKKIVFKKNCTIFHENMEKDLGNKVNKENTIKTANKKNRVEKSSKRKASYETGIIRSMSKIQKNTQAKN